MITVPELFAEAHGIGICCGIYKCFYCSAECGNVYPVSEYVKTSFTGYHSVACPGSAFVCDGCVKCLTEDFTITTIDGTVRTGQKVRCYSWVIERHAARAATKANLAKLREVCLNPPKPPYAIVLSDSGQKHLLYRGVVCLDEKTAVLTLEGERINYMPERLAERLVLCKKIVSATGKPALDEPPSTRLAIALGQRFRDGEAIFQTWEAVRQLQGSRLAAWLCPTKEECQREFPGDVTDNRLPGVSPQTPRPGESRPAASGVGEDGSKRGSDTTMFDSGPPVRGLFGSDDSLGPYRDGY